MKSAFMENELAVIREELRERADAAQAEDLQWFFKTGSGEYGEGDVFLGVRVPAVRAIARKHRDQPVHCAVELLESRCHEERQLALFILVDKYEKGNDNIRAQIYRLYLSHTAYVNNWDLVDGSAPQIVGEHLKDRSRAPLYRLAKSRMLWERRIAIIATFTLVRQDDFHDTLAVADILLRDREDLIHKAVGWMIREVGNRSLETAEAFLKERYRVMPRTMLRYAIEKYPQDKRLRYLQGLV
jgi:3-methyladenine DNA glycosylase AlkD